MEPRMYRPGEEHLTANTEETATADPSPDSGTVAADAQPAPDGSPGPAVEASADDTPEIPATGRVILEDDANLPYRVGTWSGMPNIECRECGAGFLSEVEFWDHWSKHTTPEQQIQIMNMKLYGPNGELLQTRP